MTNTRQTWAEIKEMYPDQWVYMADVDFVTGNIVSGVVFCVSKDEDDIYAFKRANRDNLPNHMTFWYTGQAIDDSEYVDNDDAVISLATEVM